MHIPESVLENETLWNMKVTMILIVISGLETVTKNLEKRLRELEIRGFGLVGFGFMAYKLL